MPVPVPVGVGKDGQRRRRREREDDEELAKAELVQLVPRPVMPPRFWVASTKPEVALGRAKAACLPWQGRG